MFLKRKVLIIKKTEFESTVAYRSFLLIPRKINNNWHWFIPVWKYQKSWGWGFLDTWYEIEHPAFQLLKK